MEYWKIVYSADYKRPELINQKRADAAIEPGERTRAVRQALEAADVVYECAHTIVAYRLRAEQESRGSIFYLPRPVCGESSCEGEELAIVTLFGVDR